MTAEIVNLRRARKAKQKAATVAQAARNRAAHGRTRADRHTAGAEVAKLASLLDGARRD